MASSIPTFIIKILCDNQGCLDFERLYELAQSNHGFKVEDLGSVLFDDGKIAVREGKEQVGDGKLIRPDSLVVAKTSLRLCTKKAGKCLQCGDLHLCKYYVTGGCTFGNKCKNPHSLTLMHNITILKRHGLQDFTETQLFQLLLQNDPFLVPEVCLHYNKGDGLYGSCQFKASCTKLHVCLHFLQGDCKFGPSCKRAHNFIAQKPLEGFSPENIDKLQKIYRNKFIITGQPGKKENTARAAPKQPSVEVPPKSPTSPTKPAAASKPISDAERNEICLFYIRRQCSYKGVIIQLQLGASHSSPTFDGFFPSAEKCARVHWHLPYRWQILDSDGVTWNDLVTMEGVEEAFCDPSRDTSCADQQAPLLGLFKLLTLQRYKVHVIPVFLDPKKCLHEVVKKHKGQSKCERNGFDFSSASSSEPHVDFKTMTYDGSAVRRLSTASSVSKPPHFVLTTDWVWYWKDDDGSWKEYGQGEGEITVTSQTLENIYLAEGETEIPFRAGKQPYILHFRDAAGKQQMYQQNVKYKTKREVRRRPRFVSAHDVEVKLKSASTNLSSCSSGDPTIPAKWDKSALPEYGYKLVLLSKTSLEWDSIKKLFKQTMPNGKIKTIARIQNPSLWKVFQWQKEQMQKRNRGKPVEEKYLFHGTDEALIDPICDQNFDWRMCGVHGTAYGKGSYFARDASYSDKYSRVTGADKKVMFVALVLVGQYSKGRSSYVKPPLKEGSRDYYDSCVDSEQNPSIFVIFEKQQIYPEYLIKYV